MNQDLLRQRRNLIVISAILLLFDFAKVEIAKVSLLGTELIVGNAQVVKYCAWILWGYFLLRYYQYWRAEPGQRIRETFKKHLDTLARAYTKFQATQDVYGQQFNDYKIRRTGLASWSYVLQGYNAGVGSIEDLRTSRLSIWRLAFWGFRSVLHVGLHTPHATDHILPFVMAFAAPLVAVLNNWQCLRLF